MVGLTTIQAFEKADLKSGDKILIHAGSGGIGSFAIQYAKSRGAFIYTTTSTSNVSWVKNLGADRVIAVSYTHLDVYKRQIQFWLDRRKKSSRLQRRKKCRSKIKYRNLRCTEIICR